MAQTWPAKSPDEVVERRWTVPLGDCDGISGVSASASGVTVDSDDYDGDEAVIVLSAGTAGTEASVAVTVTTLNGLTLVETFMIAVREQAAAFGETLRDFVGFALRKVVGAGETPTSEELADGVELFNGMIATWRMNGMDVGIASGLAAGDTVDVPDEFVLPMKFCLRRLCYTTYGVELSATEALMAAEGERLISNRLLAVGSLSMPATLAGRQEHLSGLG